MAKPLALRRVLVFTDHSRTVYTTKSYPEPKVLRIDLPSYTAVTVCHSYFSSERYMEDCEERYTAVIMLFMQCTLYSASVKSITSPSADIS